MRYQSNDLFRKVFRLSFLLFVLWAIKNQILLTKFSNLDASQIRDDIAINGVPANNNVIGQTFVARKPYLSSITFLFDSYRKDGWAEERSDIFLYLYDNAHIEIASTSYSIPNIGEDLEIELNFPPQPNSLNKSYYILIKTDAPASQLSVWTSLYNAYEDGDAYLNENVLPYDLTFWTYYRPPIFFWINETINNSQGRFAQLFVITFAVIGIGFLICFLSGYLTKDMVESTIYSMAVGVAIPPILFLVLSVLQIDINKNNILSILIVLVALAGVKFFKTVRSIKFHFSMLLRKEIAILILLFLIAVFTRVSQINRLLVPNWVGGLVHQQFITRILERHAVLFDSIYPKGFHSNVVLDYLLFGGSPTESTLLIGQWLSIMSGFTFYLLARKLLGKPYGLLAVGIYWFWAPFPAFLINWGRYPYLQSLVLLPAIAHVYNNNLLSRFSRNVLLSILIFGTGLTYYGGFLIFVAFMIASLIDSNSKKEMSEDLAKLKDTGLILLPIVMILIIRMLRALELNIYGQDANTGLYEDSIQALEISLTHGGWLIWGLGILGFALAIALKAKRFLFIMRWLLVLLMFNLLQVTFNVTVSSMANTIIFFTIPLTLLTGLMLKFLWVVTVTRTKALFYIVAFLTVICGAYNVSGIIQPSYTLFSSTDQSAMEWIIHNTPSDSLYLINSFYWGDDRAPSDGGGWITIKTDRKSLLYDPNSIEGSLDNEEIDYIYIGRGYGAITSEYLLGDGRFEIVYDKDGVKIFKRSHGL